ncbi:MAG TPA: hypothetical protein VF974_08155 [Patescibacteria group bacterium]
MIEIGDNLYLPGGNHKTTVIFVGNEYAISRCCHGDEFIWELDQEQEVKQIVEVDKKFEYE